jgi:hypothetical protein
MGRKVTSLSLSFSYFVCSSIGATNIHRITWANIKRAGDDGDQSEELMRDGEEGHLSFSFSHFVFSSIGAANIHRITWANIKRADDDGHQLKHNTRIEALEE